MNRFSIYIITAMLLGAAVIPAAAQQSKGSEIIATFDYPELEWSVPEVGREVSRQVMDNGIVLYIMEDHRLPLFEITALMRCGELYLPKKEMGIPGLVASVMRSGGTTTIGADSLNSLLELMGASLETSAGYEESRANLSVLSKDIETGIRILADVLRHPAFPEDKLEIALEERKNAIRRRNDRPGSIAAREFHHLLYGDHPYGRIAEWEHYKWITRQDLLDCHGRFYAPNNLMLGITGDFDPDELVRLLKAYFGDWEAKEVDLPDIPEVADSPKPGVYQVFKDIKQANIRLGHLGIDRDNPDRYAVAVMNFILGGGSFSSRIKSKVRSDEGLAYSVGTVFETSSHDLGEFFAYTQTKSATAHKAIRLMVDEIERIQKELIEDSELDMAKDSYLNRYVFDFSRPSQIVSELMRLEFDDRPLDLLKKYIDNIRGVTKEDILRVAQTYLKPENLTFVIVGNPADFEKPLDDFGEVHNIELTEPVLD